MAEIFDRTTIPGSETGDELADILAQTGKVAAQVFLEA